MECRFILAVIMYVCVYVMWVQFPKKPEEGHEPVEGKLGTELRSSAGAVRDLHH